ncbi:glycosyltransferase 87 family protein [Thermomonospora amylolytica]|uniref:glycosyltransferase 87 family protein n=1 Tax=Thermomonospora amylolytica TaxID=1411117 RepID=UPI000E6CF0F5|nr:glycosyltransferase 87 family protein [Thermomonospora amylolytica]
MRLAAVWGCWLATRLIGLLIIVDRFPYPRREEILGDPAIYAEWARILASGAFPEGDVRWQYPPLAAPVMLLPHRLGGDYTTTFALVALTADLVIMWLLTRSRRDGSLGGAWFWTFGIVALGPMSYVRYDLIVTVAAVAALLFLHRARLFGVLAALGALLKAWPVLLLAALARTRRSLHSVAAFAVTCGTVLLVFALARGRAPWSFLDAQVGRGLECEALAATPFMLGRMDDRWGGTIVYQYGSMELVGPHVARVADVLPYLTVVALLTVALLAWRGSGRSWNTAWGCDVAFAAVLAAVATSRVLSPQYFLWLLGLGAVCLAHRRTRQRPAVLLILAATALSQFLYPINWPGLMAAETLETWTLTARNTLVLAATLWSLIALAKGPIPVPEAQETSPAKTPAPAH